MNRAIAPVLCLIAALVVLATVGGSRAHAAICGDYPSQAAAQRAHDTRDADGDGVYCESLPCPCSATKGGSGSAQPAPVAAPDPAGCRRPSAVQNITFSATRYPNIRRHFLAALRRGWPRTLVLNRRGAEARRDRLLASYPTRPGLDRDEYPPAVGRGKGRGLERGVNPRGGARTCATCPRTRTVRRGLR
jgi:hypothetical protein